MTSLELIKIRMARRETLYLVIHDVEAKRILAAWLVYGHECGNFVVKGDEEAGSLLRRTWSESAEVDYKRLGELANVPQTRAETIFARLAAAGLLWPDGTIADQAGKLLRSESIAYVENLLPKGVRPPYEQPRPDTRGAGAAESPAPGIPKGPAARPNANPIRRRAAARHGRTT